MLKYPVLFPSLLLEWSLPISLGQWTMGSILGAVKPLLVHFTPGVSIPVCQWHVAYRPLNHPGLCQFMNMLGNTAADGSFYCFFFFFFKRAAGIFIYSFTYLNKKMIWKRKGLFFSTKCCKNNAKLCFKEKNMTSIYANTI